MVSAHDETTSIQHKFYYDRWWRYPRRNLKPKHSSVQNAWGLLSQKMYLQNDKTDLQGFIYIYIIFKLCVSNLQQNKLHCDYKYFIWLIISPFSNSSHSVFSMPCTQSRIKKINKLIMSHTELLEFICGLFCTFYNIIQALKRFCECFCINTKNNVEFVMRRVKCFLTRQYIFEHEAIPKLITYRVVMFLLLAINALKQTRTSCFSRVVFPKGNSLITLIH